MISESSQMDRDNFFVVLASPFLIHFWHRREGNP